MSNVSVIIGYNLECRPERLLWAPTPPRRAILLKVRTAAAILGTAISPADRERSVRSGSNENGCSSGEPSHGRRPARNHFFFEGTIESLNAFARRNLTTVLAGILMGSPV